MTSGALAALDTLVRLLRVLARYSKALGEAMRYGLATLCVGVGQGEATVIELA